LKAFNVLGVCEKNPLKYLSRARAQLPVYMIVLDRSSTIFRIFQRYLSRDIMCLIFHRYLSRVFLFSIIPVVVVPLHLCSHVLTRSSLSSL